MRQRRRRERGEWDAQKVKALRRHLGMTQQELAEELGTRQQTISEWETGMYRPRGPSSTLLSMVAERAHFHYGEATEPKAAEEDRILPRREPDFGGASGNYSEDPLKL